MTAQTGEHGSDLHLLALALGAGLDGLSHQDKLRVLAFGKACMKAQRAADLDYLACASSDGGAAELLRLFGPLAARPWAKTWRMNASRTDLVEVAAHRVA